MRLWLLAGALAAAGALTRQVIVPGVGTPTIVSLSVSSGPVGTSVTITGTNFNATQGSGSVTFGNTAGVNGIAATITSWSATSVVVTVPTSAITGSVFLFQNGAQSNGVPFTVTATAADCPTTNLKTVKTSGGDFTSIVSCMNTGANCQVDNGSWAGGTITASGSAVGPSYVTVFAAAAATVTMTSDLTFGSHSYIQIGCTGRGLTFSGVAVTGGGSLSATHIKYIGNTFNNYATDFIIALQVSATHYLIDGNTFGPTMHDDDIDVFNAFGVVRNNIATGITQIGDHPDFLQTYCTATTRAAAFLLVENNYAHDCVGGDCHFFQFNNMGCDAAFNVGDPQKNWIVRDNVVADMQSAMFSFQDNAPGAPQWSNFASYNNTQVRVYAGNNYTECIGCAGRTVLNAFSKNEVCYQCGASALFAFMYPIGTTLKNALLYYPSQTISTRDNLSTCVASGGCVINQDPLFTNVAGADYTLQAGSPAADTGTSLTTVTAGCTASTTSLTLADAYAFQDGTWADGVQADQIAVGSVSNHVSISAINYTTGVVTLASAISCTNTDAVWLYANSAGTVVLNGSAPDRGAKER